MNKIIEEKEGKIQYLTEGKNKMEELYQKVSSEKNKEGEKTNEEILSFTKRITSLENDNLNQKLALSQKENEIKNKEKEKEELSEKIKELNNLVEEERKNAEVNIADMKESLTKKKKVISLKKQVNEVLAFLFTKDCSASNPSDRSFQYADIVSNSKI